MFVLIRNKTRMSALITSTKHYAVGFNQGSQGRKRKKKKKDWKERKKTNFVAGDILIYTENPKGKPLGKFLEQISKFSKFARYEHHREINIFYTQ